MVIIHNRNYAPPDGVVCDIKGVETWDAYFRRLAIANPDGFIWLPSAVTFTPALAELSSGAAFDAFIVCGLNTQNSIQKTALVKESPLYFTPAACTALSAVPSLGLNFFWGIDAIFALMAILAGKSNYLTRAVYQNDAAYGRKENNTNEQGFAQVLLAFTVLNPNWGVTLRNEPWAKGYLKKFQPLPTNVAAKKVETKVLAHIAATIDPAANVKATGASRKILKALSKKLYAPNGTMGKVDISELQFITDADLDGVPRKIAFCFLVRTDTEHQKAWELFFERAAALELPFAIHAHFADGVPKGFLAPFTIDTHPTQWEYTTQALVGLVEAAKKSGADKAVFLSESCVPLKKPTEFWNRLSHNHTVVTSMGYQGRQVFGAWGEGDIAAQQWSVVDKDHFGILTPSNPIIAALFKENIHADNEYWLVGALRWVGRIGELRKSMNCYLESNKKRNPNFFTGANKKEVKNNYPNAVVMPPEKLQQLWETPMHVTGRKFDPTALTEDYYNYLAS